LKPWYKSCIISIIKDITLITEIIYFERRNNQMANRMILNETSYFGAGSISEIVTEAKKRAFKKALVVTDPDLIKFNVAKNVTDLLEEAGLAYDIFSQVKANPTVKVVKAGIEAFKAAGADYLIAIGGGSSMDTAKAIGIIINNPEYADVTSLEGAIDTKNPSVPIIAVPTTAGTAAEVTINYVITDEEKKRKFVCVDPHDIPVVAIIDAKMMSSMPKGLTASTGMDALTHAIEGYTTLGAWELTDMMHLKAIEIISRSLRKAVENDPQGREDMALGQYIAGMGFSNVGLGVVHGMAHPLGAFYDTPHGIANAVLLPYVMEYNAEYTGEKFKYIAEAMGVDTTGMSQAEYRAAAVSAVKQLSKDVGIPEKLHEIGVKEEDLQALSESAFADVCTGGNPRPCTVESILGIYKTAF
jgi:lactaldehyde reductase